MKLNHKLIAGMMILSAGASLAACSNSSNTRIPAPSPITNPDLSLSNGMLALFLSVEWDNAFIFSNPAIPIGQIVASHPPATSR